MKSYYLIACFAVSFYSCSSTKKIPVVIIEKIQFGTGGGFTGRVTTYDLFPDGRLFMEFNNKDSLLGKIHPDTLSVVISEAIVLDDYHYNQPGNMYAFLSIEKKNLKGTNDNVVQRIVWGMGSGEIEPRVIELHERLMQLVRQLTR